MKSSNPYLSTFLSANEENTDVESEFYNYYFEYYSNPSDYMYSSALKPNHDVFKAFGYIYRELCWVTSCKLYFLFLLGHIICAAMCAYMFYTYDVHDMNYFLFMLSASIVTASNLLTLNYYYFNPCYYVAYYHERYRITRLLCTLELLNIVAWVWLLVDSALPHSQYLWSVILGGSLVGLWISYLLVYYCFSKIYIYDLVRFIHPS